jgi:hypothetical protein
MSQTESRRPRRPVTIEDVVGALAAQCDGARRRDGRGFSRADASEGGRLCALKARGMAWTAEDARKANEIVNKYSKQAGALLGGGHEAREKGIEAALRQGRVGLRDAVTDSQPPYNYLGLSPGGKQVNFWRLTGIADLGGLARELKAACAPSHGVRRNHLRLDGRADITLNGARRRAYRFEADLNGTTRAGILAAAERHGFLVEPAVEEALDPEIDALRRNERAAWLHRGVRDGRKGTWAVFDLARRHEPFSVEVKARLRGRFACLEHDDWNWYVEADAATLPQVGRIVQAHGFAISADLRASLVETLRSLRARASAG